MNERKPRGPCALSLASLTQVTGGSGSTTVYLTTGTGGGTSTPPLELQSGSNTVFVLGEGPSGAALEGGMTGGTGF